MAPGKAGLSMLITGGILVVLGGIAGTRRRSVVEGEGGVPGLVATGVGAGVTIGAEVYINPLEPVPKAEWEVLTGCELVRTPTNAAHHFRVVRDGKPMVFELYFVEAPELTEPGEDEVDEHARYFGWSAKDGEDAWADRSVELGERAWKAVEDLLESKPFLVLTKFDLRRDTHHFYALVVIEEAPGRRRTLQEWLVENGYGMITRPSLGWLPLQVESDQFVERLERLQLEAQRQRRGGWGGVAVVP